MDLSKPEDEAAAERLHDELKPDFVIGSPSCTPFVQLNWGCNFPAWIPIRSSKCFKRGASTDCS